MQALPPVVPTDDLIVEAKVYRFFGVTEDGRLGYTDVSDLVAQIIFADA